MLRDRNEARAMYKGQQDVEGQPAAERDGVPELPLGGAVTPPVESEEGTRPLQTVTEVGQVETLIALIELTPQSQVLVAAHAIGIDPGALQSPSFIAAINQNSQYTGHEEVDLTEYEDVFDEISGQALPPELVAAARQVELQFLKTFPVYELVPRAASVGKRFLQVRWVEVDKGDRRKRNIRSRLVAKDFRFLNPYLTNTFAGVPPLEALLYILSFLATLHRRNGRVLEIIRLVVGVSRAHFHPYINREVYIELPPEDARDGFVGRLLRTMYGTREASGEFERFFNQVIASAGMVVGRSCPALYAHESCLLYTSPSPRD